MLFIYINTAVKMFKESQKHLKYNSELDSHFICATHCSRNTLVPEVYFYYFHCEGERKNKPLVESGN